MQKLLKFTCKIKEKIINVKQYNLNTIISQPHMYSSNLDYYWQNPRKMLLLRDNNSRRRGCKIEKNVSSDLRWDNRISWREIGGERPAPVPESMLSKREQLRNEYICTRAMLAHRYPAWQVPNTSRGRRARCKLGFMLTLQRIKFHVPALCAVANFSPPMQYSRRQVNAEYISVNDDSPLPSLRLPSWPLWRLNRSLWRRNNDRTVRERSPELLQICTNWYFA